MKPTERERFERWYLTHAKNIADNPIGSRKCNLQWEAWQAAVPPYEPTDAMIDAVLDKRLQNLNAEYKASINEWYELRRAGVTQTWKKMMDVARGNKE